jgi:hypothetical protein
MSAGTARALADGDVQPARAVERLGAHTGATQRSYGDESQPTYWAHAPPISTSQTMASEYLSLGLRMALRRSRAAASMWMRRLGRPDAARATEAVLGQRRADGVAGGGVMAMWIMR